jgi:hypothetical protein
MLSAQSQQKKLLFATCKVSLSHIIAAAHTSVLCWSLEPLGTHSVCVFAGAVRAPCTATVSQHVKLTRNSVVCDLCVCAWVAMLYLCSVLVYMIDEVNAAPVIEFMVL